MILRVPCESKHDADRDTFNASCTRHQADPNVERETFCPDPKGEARRSSYGVKALDNMNNCSLRALPCLLTAYLSQKITSRDDTT